MKKQQCLQKNIAKNMVKKIPEKVHFVQFFLNKGVYSKGEAKELLKKRGLLIYI